MTDAGLIESSPAPRSSALAWAAYLGASWTWCIGMFLPVILVRDYGPWGWVIFAVPNCVGAAAMGWLMRSAGQSRDYADRHAAAGLLFGYVTIAFQVFFALWMIPRLIGPIAGGGLAGTLVGFVPAVVLIQLAFTPVGGDRRLTLGGAAALVVSVVLLGLAALRGALVMPEPFTASAADLLGLTCVCLLGFTTCPYLDLTFHRARMSTTVSGGRLAFGVGFCVLFAAMVVGTLLYATNFYRLTGVAAALVGTHVALQMAYTVNLHAIEIGRRAQRFDGPGVRTWTGLALAVALLAGLGGRFADAHGLHYGRLGVGELGYRGFLAFYGLLFPAYVLLAVGGRRVSPTAWAAVSAAGLPFYWIAFMEGRLGWGVVGAAVVVAGVITTRIFTDAANQ